jgi:hypothetical protein
LVDDPLALSLEDIKTRSRVTMPEMMECGGNGRAQLSPVPWHEEAVGCAEWTRPGEDGCASGRRTPRARHNRSTTNRPGIRAATGSTSSSGSPYESPDSRLQRYRTFSKGAISDQLSAKKLTALFGRGWDQIGGEVLIECRERFRVGGR